MQCTKCSGQLPDGSKFCNHCGASLSAPAVPPPVPIVASPKPATAPGPLGSAPGPDEPEQPVWKGHASPKAFLHWWALWGVWVGLLLYLLLGVIPKTHRPGWLVYIFLGIMAVPALVLTVKILLARFAIRYRLTTHRFFKETGLLGRKIAELELIRVDDIQAQQSFLQRLFNVGTVTIISTDATDPRLLVVGIENPIEVKEQIRTNVRKRRARVVNLGQVG